MEEHSPREIGRTFGEQGGKERGIEEEEVLAQQKRKAEAKRVLLIPVDMQQSSEVAHPACYSIVITHCKLRLHSDMLSKSGEMAMSLFFSMQSNSYAPTQE